MDFNKIKEMGLEYAEKARTLRWIWPKRGKTQALIVNEQASCSRHSASWRTGVQSGQGQGREPAAGG